MDPRPFSLDTPLAHGRTADVFEWDDGYVLKLFHNWFPLGDVEYELKIARAVHASGVRSPAIKALIQVQGRNGLIYERVSGNSMLTMFQRKPWTAISLARTFAQLHAQMHTCTFKADVPGQRQRLQHKIQDAAALHVLKKSALLKALDSMPDGDKVCHGDFHPANVLISSDDSSIIDWIDASSGNPAADVARTSIILLGAFAGKQIRNVMVRMFVGFFHAAYLREYSRLRPLDGFEYRRWLPIVAGARLSENIPELESWLVTQAKKIE